MFSTIVSMLISLSSATTVAPATTSAPGTTGSPTTTPSSNSTVPVVTIDDAAVTTTTLLGEVIPAPTTTTTPPPATVPAGVPVELLLVGGSPAQTVGTEFANKLWPMKVRMVTGDPVSQAIKMLTPTAQSQVLVYDPSLPVDPANYLSYISSITTAASNSRILWVEDWRTGRDAWRQAISEVAKSSKNIVIVPIYADAAKKGWVESSGMLQEAGRTELISRIVRAAQLPKR